MQTFDSDVIQSNLDNQLMFNFLSSKIREKTERAINLSRNQF